MDKHVMRLYQRLSARGTSHIVGRYAEGCLRGARVIAKFRELEDTDKVRIVAEPEQESYFSVYGEPDTAEERDAMVAELELNGCWWVCAQVACPKCGEWQHVDSVGMCTGYSNPTDPMQNVYVIDLMESALAAVED